MTNKDALRIIKFQMKDECLSCGTFECSESDFFCDTREAFIFSIKALEKQIPKKPYRISNSILHCSVCSSPVRLGEVWDDNFCDVCGQAIDWSDVDEEANI